jgi:D-alanyl-D-alanine carboxypeptidase/D-alanyl-D-alanine-endopeptidase (penicillin-binding protein 4)
MARTAALLVLVAALVAAPAAALVAAPAVALVAAPAVAPVAGAKTLQARLAHDLDASGPASGAHVLDLTRGRVLFSVRAAIPRVMMSNTKLFTTGAVLESLGPRTRFETVALGSAAIGTDGVLAGDLHLHGGGDPTFGDAAVVIDSFAGEGATVQDLVARLQAAGLRHMLGRVVGDGSLFDSELGPPQWELNDTPPGPVGALQFNRGIVGQGAFGPEYTPDPAAFAAEGLRRALVAAGVVVDGGAATGPTPAGAVRLAAVESPPVAALVRLTNKPSDNLLAETLAKQLGLKTHGLGTRKAGVAAALRFGRRLGVRAEIHTGSGAFPYPRAAPRQLVKLLVALRKLPTFGALHASLPIAGRDGTLAGRMRRGPARDRCQAKTGSNFAQRQRDQASVLSGYCRTRGRHLVVFSLMMNEVRDVEAARRLQDGMVQAIAGYKG